MLDRASGGGPLEGGPPPGPSRAIMRPHWIATLSLLLLTPQAVVAGTSEPQADHEEARCRRAALEDPPSWSWSGAWSHDGTRLVLVDVADGGLKVYDRRGELLETIRRPGTGVLDFTRPNSIVALDDGYWLKDGSSHFVRLDPDLTPRDGVDTASIAPGPMGIPRAFFNWTATSEHLYALGDVLLSEEERAWESGWLELDLQAPRRARIFRPAPSEDALHRLYRLGYPYATADGDRIYFLLMETDGVGILQVAPRIRRLRAFPEGFDSLPRPPSSRGGRHTARVYALLQQARYPAGLYAWGERLFVLTRSPREEGGTRWTLHVVDPERDEVTRTLTLPTDAAHLSLVPGPRSWALLEKGEVESETTTRQPIERVQFLGVDLFEGSTPSLEASCRSVRRTSDE